MRGRPFQRGVSGNPGGRPKGFGELIRRETRDGAELVQFMLGVFRGEVKQASLRDRVAAVSWLADRGFGKPPTSTVDEDPVEARISVVFTDDPDKLRGSHPTTNSVESLPD